MINDYKIKTYFLIDISVATNDNISVKEYDRIRKYKDLGK